MDGINNFGAVDTAIHVQMMAGGHGYHGFETKALRVGVAELRNKIDRSANGIRSSRIRPEITGLTIRLTSVASGTAGSAAIEASEIAEENIPTTETDGLPGDWKVVVALLSVFRLVKSEGLLDATSNWAYFLHDLIKT